jgi:hypothetical protein
VFSKNRAEWCCVSAHCAGFSVPSVACGRTAATLPSLCKLVLCECVIFRHRNNASATQTTVWCLVGIEMIFAIFVTGLGKSEFSWQVTQTRHTILMNLATHVVLNTGVLEKLTWNAMGPSFRHAAFLTRAGSRLMTPCANHSWKPDSYRKTLRLVGGVGTLCRKHMCERRWWGCSKHAEFFDIKFTDFDAVNSNHVKGYFIYAMPSPINAQTSRTPNHSCKWKVIREVSTPHGKVSD